MLKNVSSLTHKVGDRLYTLYCDMDSPIQEVKEALFKFVGYVDQIEEAVKAHALQQAESAAPEAPPEPLE